MNKPLEAAMKVLSSLEELVADPHTDFGPAYEGAIRRKEEAIAIMKRVIAEMQRKPRSSP